MNPEGHPPDDRDPGRSRGVAPVLDAVVLAGGRSSRLGGTPKSGLRLDDLSLLDRTLATVAQARLIVVVGDVACCPSSVLQTREDPPFGGPAAGIGAGLAALAEAGDRRSDYTVVLACDMPAVAASVDCLLRVLTESHGDDRLHADDPDGYIAVAEDGRHQPLVAIYDTAALTRAVARAKSGSGLNGASVFGLISGLDLKPVAVPPGSTEDVDTWQDAERFGIVRVGVNPSP